MNSQLQMLRTSSPSDHQAQQHQQLQNLVHILGWSYAALWTLSPEQRVLKLKGGYFNVSNRGTGALSADVDIWNMELFYSTYKSCSIAPGLGSVGRANSEGRPIWLNGTSIYQHTCSLEHAQFLKAARIETMMCVPWQENVLELGTSASTAKNLELMSQVQKVMAGQSEAFFGSQNTTNFSSQPPLPTSFQRSVPGNNNNTNNSMMQQLSPRFRSLSPIRQAQKILQDVNWPTFELNCAFSTILSLTDQNMRSSTSMSSLNRDMFMEHPVVQRRDSDNSRRIMPAANSGLDFDMLDQGWRLPSTTAITTRSTGLMAQGTAGQYRSLSGTSTSSVSSQEDYASARTLSIDSPEDPGHVPLKTSNSPSNSTSSTQRRATSSSHNNPEGQLVPASTTLHHLREDHDIQKALSLMLAEATPMDNQNHWREINYNPSSQEIAAEEDLMNLQGPAAAASGFDNPNTDSMMKNNAQDLLVPQVHGPFKSWRHTKILAPVLENNNCATNQLLLRRCINLMKKIPLIHQSRIVQTEGMTLVETMNQQGPPTTSSESPETVQEIAQVLEPIPVFQAQYETQIQVGPPRIRNRLGRGGARMASSGLPASASGAVHAGHDEAAMSHMLAERRRRVKQKENFTALRKLVPIISKADKASILGDAIVYLKDLQNKIAELEESKKDGDERHENLKRRYKELEHRNKELEAQLSGAGSFSGHPRSTRLHSMQSL